MERNKAIKITAALDELEGYEFFMDNIDQAIKESSNLCSLSVEFLNDLDRVLQKELARREKVLADL